MAWVVINEYVAVVDRTPEGTFAKFDEVESRLVEQKWEVFDGPMRPRAFSLVTTLIHIKTDCALWIEITPSNGADCDLEAGEERYMTVAPGAQMVATKIL